MAKIHWFFGMLCVLIIIIAGAVLGLSSRNAAIVLSAMVIILAPFILIWSNRTRKHDDNIHYHDPKYYRDRLHKRAD
ncbi:MAG: hypothetical protein ACJ75J_11585 [Cytophagaceae bacterium]